ncbi:MAG TPA: hypothetical protein PKM58_03340 [Pyrinomonadaceae bacterium]|nr:hypothetical protein [Pyrinomonadaceae bacterium]
MRFATVGHRRQPRRPKHCTVCLVADLHQQRCGHERNRDFGLADRKVPTDPGLEARPSLTRRVSGTNFRAYLAEIASLGID